MKVFSDSAIWAGSPPAQRRGWIAFDDAGISAIGTDADAPPPNAEVVGTRRHVLPGFVDCHSHLSSSAFLPMALDGTNITSPHSLLAQLRAWSQGVADGSWLVVFNLDWERWPGARAPSARALNDASGDRSVLLADITLHRGVLSETAMRALDLPERGADPHGDIEIGRDGRATGVVWEAEFGRALSHALGALSAKVTVEALDALLDREADRHLACGITDVHEPGVPIAIAPRIERLRARTALRISWSATGAAGMMSVPQREDLGMSFGAGKPSAKLFLDGAHRCAMCLTPGTVLRMTGAAFAQSSLRRDIGPLRELLAYRTQIRGRHIHVPYLRFEMAELMRRIDMLCREGVSLRIHALGNLAVRQAVDAMQAAAPGVRATIEHLSLLTDDDADAVASGGHIAAIQPGFIPQYGPYMRGKGVVPALRGIPARSLAERGVLLALSSDNPCGPLDPLHNMRMAVFRGEHDERPFEPREALSREDAMAAATLNGMVAIDGSVRPGLITGTAADFAVVDGDPFDGRAQVVETWIGGSRVWRRSP